LHRNKHVDCVNLAEVWKGDINPQSDLDGISHHIRYLAAPLLSLLGLSAAGAWPIVAISPHPPVIAEKCSAPPLEAWSKLYAGRSAANNQQP